MNLNRAIHFALQLISTIIDGRPKILIVELLRFKAHMLISKIRVTNYKSFRDSGWLQFKPGINIIVGQNSAGKTALLEALTLDFKDIPHKSISTSPTPLFPLELKSKVNFCLEFERQEARDIAAQLLKPYRLIHPSELEPSKAIQLFQEWLDSLELRILDLSVYGQSLLDSGDSRKSLTFGLYDTLPIVDGQCTHIVLQEDSDGRLIKTAYSDGSRAIIDGTVGNLFKLSRKRIYRFVAERFNVGSCGRAYDTELSPDASNLPEVLGIMQGSNPELFNLFNDYVSIVFPQIKRISILQGQSIEIKVWPVEPSTFREDLSFPLSDCGTGVGQVLAILCVVLTSQYSRVIIIDEPQSFLHPGAAKKLIEILRETGRSDRFPQHQYIISTHSPTIISAAEASTILMLRYTESCETIPATMNSEDTKELKSLLDEVGIRLSDVFGMDKILWVEGPTEEKCYPLILERILKKPLRGIQVLAVKTTGDLEGKRAHTIFDIYDKLSGSQGLFPPAIGFMFDRELRSGQEMEDLRKRTSNPVRFILRRMFENYLLHPEAIAAVLANLDLYRESNLLVSDITKLLNEKLIGSNYLPKGKLKDEIPSLQWSYENVDGAKILKDLFLELSEARVEFSKTRDSVKITEWLIDNQPEHLQEVSNLLNEVL